jgi:hypothetical protein
MLSTIKSLFSKKTSDKETLFLETNDVSYYLGRATSLKEEMQSEFVLQHIVEAFWLTSDLEDILYPTKNMTRAQSNLLNAVSNWSRDQYGFCRAEENQPCSAKNVFIGGDLGYSTGMLPSNSLQGLHTKTVEEYCTSEHYEYLGKVYQPLFVAIITQFKDLLTELKNEQI